MIDRTTFVPGFTKKSKKSKKKSRWNDRMGNPDNRSSMASHSGRSATGGIVETEVSHGWVPQGEYVEVAGRIVPGMVYICNSEQNPDSNDGFSNTVFCVDVSKSANGSDHMGEYFEFTDESVLELTKYGKLEPENRGSYLDWLASGKKNKHFHYFYPMMYFAGLEYRLLKDDCTENEMEQILNEVKRLESIFGKNRKIAHFFPRFFQLIDIVFASTAQDLRKPTVFSKIPLALQVEISDRIQEGKNLFGDVLFDWFSYDYVHDIYNSYPIRNLKNSFLEKFAEFHPNGLKVESPDKFHIINYFSIGRDYLHTEHVGFNGRPVLDISFMEAPLHKAEAILDAVSREQFNLDVSRGNRKSKTVSLIDFASTQDGSFNGHTPVYFPETTDWARGIARERIQITAGELTAKLTEGGGETDKYPTIEEMIDALALIGIGMAPHDAFLSTPYLKPETPVFLYESRNNHRLEHWKTPVFIVNISRLLAGAYLFYESGFNREEIRKKLLDVISVSTAMKRMEKSGILANIEYVILMPFDASHIKEILDTNSDSFVVDFGEALIFVGKRLNLDRTILEPKLTEIIGYIFSRSQSL